MGADIKKLRGRIKSVNSTLHLTKAMGLVASSKIRKATEAMGKSKEYRDAISGVVDMLTISQECAKSPYMKKGKGDRHCLIVIAGDRGLAGGYNANVFRLAKEVEAAEVITIGKRACERYGKELCLAEKFDYAQALDISKAVCDGFASGEFDRVSIIGTKYISIMSQEAEMKQIFPLEKKEDNVSSTVLFEPDEMTILNSVIYEYFASVLYACVKESYASEVAARRFAMDSAGKNAQKMLDDMQLRYNRARQGAITQEITEIVAGSDS